MRKSRTKRNYEIKNLEELEKIQTLEELEEYINSQNLKELGISEFNFLDYMSNETKLKYLKFINKWDLRRSKPFLHSYFSKNYQLLDCIHIVHTSCAHETFYILYHPKTNDLLLVQDFHACFCDNSQYPKIINLDKIYKLLDSQKSIYEKEKKFTFEEYKNKPYTFKKEYEFNESKTDTLNWIMNKINEINNFINCYFKKTK